MIVLSDIHKVYRTGKLDVPVLSAINLTVTAGEYVAIMGPSGSGKSTMMNIIGCLDRPTEGTYHLDGRDVSLATDLELAQTRNEAIGFVFQQFQLLPRMSALQNVALPLVYAGVNKKERSKRAKEALIRVGLGDRMDHRPMELSGGQQQRVAIARALVNQPLLLLADEPTGALDTASGAMVMDLFDELHAEGKTVVIITHEREVAERAHRQILLRDGQVVEDTGRADEEQVVPQWKGGEGQ
ncbi:ABC transporter ATP-binding protein [Mechercharimyces sp. CAU 1602]|uniref:ABC transporter ATP-binding protein n=1 Tax=Mechercharimyces sp. CAU 1602 TaxID=2973933 RepID=UPI002163BBE8|nr:ABC transporter ATP-binding protein [Mechercharimyces sp. CAU 1602]MCS1352470.1 ABC transporter ATP-binding protein [Mechercharimyces sp. CAU 1602]